MQMLNYIHRVKQLLVEWPALAKLQQCVTGALRYLAGAVHYLAGAVRYLASAVRYLACAVHYRPGLINI